MSRVFHQPQSTSTRCQKVKFSLETKQVSFNSIICFNFKIESFNESPQLRNRGPVGGYLDRYGFGWLLDQNDTDIDKEDSAPILEELDINVNEIKYKIKCVVMPISNPSLNRSVLRDNPDFWGPLMIVLAFALLSVYGQFKVSKKKNT